MNSVSIILPCYNPPPGWDQYVRQGFDFLERDLGLDVEIIIVNDGSTAAISTAALDFLRTHIKKLQYLSYPHNKGKGHALRQGVRQAAAPIVLYTDIDFPYTLQSLGQVWETLDNGGADIVAGVKDEAYYTHVPTFRVFISKILRFFIGLLLRMPITDTQCGLKGFNAKGKAVFLSTVTDRYLCDLEFLYKAFRHKPKLDVYARPVSLRGDVVFRKMDRRILWQELKSFLKIIRKKH
ncbi:MAG: glycosyltransferase [Edaphocola sp.]